MSWFFLSGITSKWEGFLGINNINSQAAEELETANSQLESEIAYLTAEREQLEMMLDAHVCNMDKAAGRGPAWTWQKARSANATLKKMS